MARESALFQALQELTQPPVPAARRPRRRNPLAESPSLQGLRQDLAGPLRPGGRLPDWPVRERGAGHPRERMRQRPDRGNLADDVVMRELAELIGGGNGNGGARPFVVPMKGSRPRRVPALRLPIDL